MRYYTGGPVGRDGRKPRKWIKRLEVEPSPVCDGLDVFTAECKCREAIHQIRRAAAAVDRQAVARWKKELRARHPVLHAVLRRSGHTLEPDVRAALTIMDRELAKLFRSNPRR